MLDKASLKLGLDHAVLQSMSGNKEGNNNGPVQQFSKKEIEDLLRKGAYAAIMDENVKAIASARRTSTRSCSEEPPSSPSPVCFKPWLHEKDVEDQEMLARLAKTGRYITEKIMDINKKNNTFFIISLLLFTF
ncbi:chromodomain-helicase-DNA-binding protein 8-like [Gymnodraco acuticeps]|uniref:Chromodomain-helicase-DNA-binding protein 8-like n=1 Tax=Gymnodraco acuticeps TaxID=8218 RepID=A0A6P8WJE4_GYMAC|nr:chromodomain-helicase-DNA-binding protein 8-like [Gymnodraco acuticeps]